MFLAECFLAEFSFLPHKSKKIGCISILINYKFDLRINVYHEISVLLSKVVLFLITFNTMCNEMHIQKSHKEDKWKRRKSVQGCSWIQATLLLMHGYIYLSCM